MPKIDGTRKQIAAELKERLTNGPSFSEPMSSSMPPFSPEEASVQYRRWAESWILGPLCQLVPELKKASLDQTEPKLKRCSHCKAKKPDVKFRKDPYQEDVHGKSAHRNLCNSCERQISAAI